MARFAWISHLVTWLQLDILWWRDLDIKIWPHDNEPMNNSQPVRKCRFVAFINWYFANSIALLISRHSACRQQGLKGLECF